MQAIKDRVIIKQSEAEEVVGGIIIPNPKKLPTGMVVNVGSEVKHVKQGDKLLFTDRQFQKFTHNREDFVIINEADVVAIINEE